jgi:hypothetical protein
MSSEESSDETRRGDTGSGDVVFGSGGVSDGSEGVAFGSGGVAGAVLDGVGEVCDACAFTGSKLLVGLGVSSGEDSEWVARLCNRLEWRDARTGQYARK